MAHRFVTETLGAPKRIEEAFTLMAGEREDLGRKSIIWQRFQSERGKAEVDLQQVLDAKKEAENMLLQVTEDLEKAQGELREERLRREALEAQCAELEATCVPQEAALDKRRARTVSLEEEVAKLRGRREARRARWWGRRDEAPPSEPATPGPGG